MKKYFCFFWESVCSSRRVVYSRKETSSWLVGKLYSKQWEGTYQFTKEKGIWRIATKA